jgi:plasmid stabilization system protein ParE
MRIRWTGPAARDLTRICDYIEKNAGSEKARDVALAIYQGINSLTRFPRR